MKIKNVAPDNVKTIKDFDCGKPFRVCSNRRLAIKPSLSVGSGPANDHAWIYYLGDDVLCEVSNSLLVSSVEIELIVKG